MSTRAYDLREFLRETDLRRFARFVVVGLSNTVVALLVYAGLVALGTQPVPASALGFAAGALNGYRLNRNWTFDGASGGLGTGTRYVLVQLVGLGLNALGVWIAVGHAGLPRMAGETVILPVVTVTTFLLSRRWVFHAPAAR